MANSFKQKGQEGLENLEKLKGHDLEVAYITAMIDGHRAALKTIDQFVLVVNNPELKKLLFLTRHHVRTHLAKAIVINKQLAG